MDLVSWHRRVYLHCPLIDASFQVFHFLESKLAQEVDDPSTSFPYVALEDVLVVGPEFVNATLNLT